MIFAPSENECSAQVVLPLLIEVVSGPGLKNGEVMPCYGCVKFLVFFFFFFFLFTFVLASGRGNLIVIKNSITVASACLSVCLFSFTVFMFSFLIISISVYMCFFILLSMFVYLSLTHLILYAIYHSSPLSTIHSHYHFHYPLFTITIPIHYPLNLITIKNVIAVVSVCLPVCLLLYTVFKFISLSLSVYIDLLIRVCLSSLSPAFRPSFFFSLLFFPSCLSDHLFVYINLLAHSLSFPHSFLSSLFLLFRFI